MQTRGNALHSQAVLEGGGGSEIQGFGHQKWPKNLFPLQNLIFLREGNFGWSRTGGGGGAEVGVEEEGGGGLLLTFFRFKHKAAPAPFPMSRKCRAVQPDTPKIVTKLAIWQRLKASAPQACHCAAMLHCFGICYGSAAPPPLSPPPIPSGCGFFTGPWTVTRPSLRMLRRLPSTDVLLVVGDRRVGFLLPGGLPGLCSGCPVGTACAPLQCVVVAVWGTGRSAVLPFACGGLPHTPRTCPGP